MSDFALKNIEAAMRFARGRSAVLAADVANARTPGFIARDAARAEGEDGASFGAVLRDVDAHGTVGVLEYKSRSTDRLSLF
jgi:flagellar basal body rod protein FlgB